MSKYSNIPKNSKININWRVKQYDYSIEQKNNLVSKISEKYGIPRRHIRVTPIIINPNGDEIIITNEIISDIQKPDFQIKLFQHYLKENKIENFDFNLIKEIDCEINNKIDYKVYDNFCRYSINWIKWSNFLSYGEDNFFDFRELSKLVLLTGKPGNTSGKTTFAIELLHFLLFGKTNKAKTLDKIFNNHLTEATEVSVEGSLTIEGEEYIIKRILTRPSASKRTKKSKATQKVYYYKVVGDIIEELNDADNLASESSVKTNKVIKKVIGDETDFDLVICATSKNLSELVSKTEGERGKLFAKWIGLLPIQEKNEIARKHFNELKTTFKSNIFNRQDLLLKIEKNELTIKEVNDFIKRLGKENEQISVSGKKTQEQINVLNQSKKEIDTTLAQINEETLKKKKEEIAKNVEILNIKIQEKEREIKELNFQEKENSSLLNARLEDLNKELSKLNQIIGETGARYRFVQNDLISFKEQGKVCPTCHRPYTDEEYNDYINKRKKEIADITEEGKQMRVKITSVTDEINQINIYKENEKTFLKLSMNKNALEVQKENLKREETEINLTEEKYKTNKEAIDKNNKITIEINNLTVQLQNQVNTFNNNLYLIGQKNNEITTLTNEIELNKNIIKEIEREEVLIRNWNIYLDMVGKNGISKMVLRKTLPIINANLALLLADACDFTLEVEINEKNEVIFNMCRDGVKQDLSTCGSGYEETISSLALRAVLGKISTIPRMNFLLLDEIFATISKENLPKIEKFLHKMLDDYNFIFVISHMDEINNWFDKIITITKENNISHIEMTKQKNV